MLAFHTIFFIYMYIGVRIEEVYNYVINWSSTNARNNVVYYRKRKSRVNKSTECICMFAKVQNAGQNCVECAVVGFNTSVFYRGARDHLYSE